ncbi:MAG TPA: SRPBCC domain-containing protein, partial [Phycisphaerales bacterium]|nr:SRPBCC domain-containing protein [Phycisphaerales bacterium]
WVESREDADQRITRLEPDRRLAFTWTWRGAPCVVEYVITPDSSGSATDLEVVMSCGGERMGFGDECSWFLADLVTYTVGNLRSYLETGRAALRPDFRDTSRGVDLSIVIRATPERVFRALTDPREMDEWISTAARADVRAGGEYTYGWMIPPGHACGPTRLVEVVPNRLVVHDWGYKDEPRTEVRWELTPVSEGTRVRLVHVRRNEQPEIGGYMQGWSSFLVMLQEYATLGRASRRPIVDPAALSGS